MQARMTSHLALLTMLTALASGCAGEAASIEGYPVSGTVTLDGEPLPFAMLEVAPEGFPDLRHSLRVVEGKFEALAEDGLTPGTYSVRVLPYEPEIEEVEAALKAGKPSPIAARKTIPAPYTKVGALTAEVVTDKPNVWQFQLKSGGG